MASLEGGLISEGDKENPKKQKTGGESREIAGDWWGSIDGGYRKTMGVRQRKSGVMSP